MAVDKLVDSTQLDADLTSVANAIRTKGGTSASLAFPADFVSAIGAIPSGSTMDFDDFLNGTFPTGAFTADSATVIPAYSCYNRKNITSVYSTTVTDLREFAFYGCSNLVSVELPNLTVMRVGTGTNTNSNGSFFQNCNILATIKMPKLENIYGNYAFATQDNNNANTTIVLPKIKNLGVRAFRQRQCAAVDLGPDLVQILADTFYNSECSVCILRKTSVVPTVSADAIMSLRSVYVPQSLIATYKTSSNWSTRFNAGYITFYAIEGSQYENYYADGTPIATT